MLGVVQHAAPVDAPPIGDAMTNIIAEIARLWRVIADLVRRIEALEVDSREQSQPGLQSGQSNRPPAT